MRCVHVSHMAGFSIEIHQPLGLMKGRSGVALTQFSSTRINYLWMHSFMYMRVRHCRTGTMKGAPASEVPQHRPP